MPTSFHVTAPVATVMLVLASLAARPGAAQEFSADVVRTPAQGTETTRIYVGASKIRLRTLDAGQPAASVIFDVAQHSTTILLDKQHQYLGGSNSPLVSAVLNGSGFNAFWRIFRPVSTGTPCDDWNALVLSMPRTDSMRTPPHFTCSDAGRDAVNGRSAEKWAVTSTDNGKTSSGYAWIDTKLHVVSKTQDNDASMEMRNVSEGPQPDSLFAIPADYRPVDATALLSRFKNQSVSATAAGMLGDAAKDVGNTAKTATADAAKQKTKDETKKKIKSIFHVP